MFVDCFGSLLIGGICLWGVLFASKEFIRMVESDTTSDRTLAPVRRQDNPNLFGLHVLGFVIFIIANAAIGIEYVLNATRHFPLLDANAELQRSTPLLLKREEILATPEEDES